MLPIDRSFTYMQNRFNITKSTKGWWKFTCPVCGGGQSDEVSAAVNFQSETVKCWRAKCGYKDSLTNFIKDTENLDSSYKVKLFIGDFEPSVLPTEIDSNYSYIKVKEVIAIDLPYGYRSLKSGDNFLAKKARRYLKNRGFDIDKLDDKGFGYCDEEHEDFMLSYYGFIIIPFSIRGVFTYFIGRDFLGGDKKYKYKNPTVTDIGVRKSSLFYNEDGLYQKEKIYLVEGWSCAETIGDNAIAYLGNVLSAIQRTKILRSKVKELIFIPDVGAYKKALGMALDFIEYFKVKVIDLEKTGLTTKIKNDVNSIGFRELKIICDNQEYLSYSDIYLNF